MGVNEWADEEVNKTRQDKTSVKSYVLHSISYSLLSIIPCWLFWMEEQIIQHDNTHFQILQVTEVVVVID